MILASSLVGCGGLITDYDQQQSRSLALDVVTLRQEFDVIVEDLSKRRGQYSADEEQLVGTTVVAIYTLLNASERLLQDPSHSDEGLAALIRAIAQADAAYRAAWDVISARLQGLDPMQRARIENLNSRFEIIVARFKAMDLEDKVERERAIGAIAAAAVIAAKVMSAVAVP